MRSPPRFLVDWGQRKAKEFTVSDVHVDKPRPGEVHIKIQAAALNAI